jgi:hypothetical protein
MLSFGRTLTFQKKEIRMLNRQVTHFSVGNKIYWFNGSSRLEKPQLVPMVVVCVQLNEMGRVVVSASEDVDSKPHNINIRSISEDCNWTHRVDGFIHTFVVTNPWFLSGDEVEELSILAKEKLGHLQVLRWLENVSIPQGSRTSEFMNAVANWSSFWKRYKFKK